jgi:hypothetical protein
VQKGLLGAFWDGREVDQGSMTLVGLDGKIREKREREDQGEKGKGKS